MFVAFFNSFSISKCFVLFDVTFYLFFLSLSWKPAFFTKLAISILLVKFICANFATKFFAVNSGVVVYVSWSW